jgi:hypothetical protein
MKIVICALIALLLMLCSLPAGAQIIFSNFGTNLGQGGWVVSGTQNAGQNGFFLGQETQTAESFTVFGTSSYLSRIDIAAQLISGSNAFLVTLNQNSNVMPGQVLEQWTITNAAPFGNGSPAYGGFETVYSTGKPLLLTTGSTYWLVVSPLDPNSSTLGAWHDSSIALGGVDQQVNGAGWQTYAGHRGAFSVQGPLSPVPEPGTFVLFGTGLLGLGSAIKRKILS